jgi:hypothetical protein
MRGAAHVVFREEKRNTCRVLLGKSEEKRPPIKTVLRREETNKFDLTKTGCDDVGLI